MPFWTWDHWLNRSQYSRPAMWHRPVLEPVHLFERQPLAVERPSDVPPARRPQIDRQKHRARPLFTPK